MKITLIEKVMIAGLLCSLLGAGLGFYFLFYAAGKISQELKSNGGIKKQVSELWTGTSTK